MTTKIKNYAPGVTERVHYARLSATNVVAGATGTLANASDASMLTYKGFATFTDTPATATNQPIEGDGGNLGDMFVRALESSTGTITFNTLDATYQAAAEDLTIYTDGDHEKLLIDDQCTVLNNLGMIINSRATSLEAATLNEQGWEVTEIFKTTSEKTDSGASGTEFSAQPQGYNLTYIPQTTDMEGIAITDVNYNRTKGRGQRYWAENPVIIHTLMGDGIVVAVTLQETPAAEDGAKVLISVDGVRLDYTTDYTVDATTKVVTFVAAPGAGEEVAIRYEYLISC